MQSSKKPEPRIARRDADKKCLRNIGLNPRNPRLRTAFRAFGSRASEDLPAVLRTALQADRLTADYANECAFTLVELLAGVAITAVLAAVVAASGWKVYENSSLAISANNIRQLSAGCANYLAENNYTFWPYRATDQNPPAGVTWWFGYESQQSLTSAEGARSFDAGRGPLAGYLPASFRPDPSFKLGGNAFKPKYQFGYIGIGYNVLLGGGWIGTAVRRTYWSLADPSKVVVFATSAQVNTFQKPASLKKPMIEEFYGIDQRETTVHFRHHGYAMVAFANGAAGILPMDKSTLDKRLPKANVGRFAPVGDRKYLE